MKKIVTLLICSFFVFSLHAQSNGPAKKGYAFQQATLPGKAPTPVVHENGTTVERERKPNVSYFIFMEFRQSQFKDIRPSRIWIRGKEFGIKSETIASTPFIISRSFGPRVLNDTLVKKTSNTVIRIQPVTASVSSGLTKAVTSKIKSDNMVVEYYYKNKKYYHIINSIPSLPPQVMQ